MGDGFDSGGTGEEGSGVGGLTSEESFDGENGVGSDGDLGGGREGGREDRHWMREERRSRSEMGKMRVEKRGRVIGSRDQ